MARISLDQLYVQLYEDEKDIVNELPKLMKSQRLNKRELVIEAIRYYIHAINEGKAGFQPSTESETIENAEINERPQQEEVVETLNSRFDPFGDQFN